MCPITYQILEEAMYWIVGYSLPLPKQFLMLRNLKDFANVVA